MASGVKIDLDEAREQNAFAKTQIVVAEETLDEVIAKPIKEGSTPKVVISEEAPAEVIKSAQNSSSRAIASAIKEAMNSARKSEVENKRSAIRANSERRPPASSSRPVSIGPEKSDHGPKVSDRSVPVERTPGLNAKPEDRPRPPEAPIPSNKRPDAPPNDHERPDADREEIDMMPKTDAELRQYWTTRLQIIKTRFPDVIIPRKAAEMEWVELRKIYYIELDRVSITKNVDSYKMILTVLIFICEYIGSKVIKIDCTGFAAHSLRSMHRYDRLLIELGEKNYSSFGENWPVEFRLGAMVLVNFVIYCIAKYLFKVTGQDMSDNFFEMFQSMGSASVESDLPPGTGMDAPNPNATAPGESSNGLGGLLGNLMGALTGGKGGGGLEGILGGLMGNLGGATKPQTTSAAPQTEDGNRINIPRYRRKTKKPVVGETAPQA